MKKYYLLLLLFGGLVGLHLFHGLVYSKKWTEDYVPLVGDWEEKRSDLSFPIPFRTYYKNNHLRISSFRKMENVKIRIISMAEVVHHEEVRTFLPFKESTLPLTDLAEGEYMVELSHENGLLNGYFKVTPTIAANTETQ